MKFLLYSVFTVLIAHSTFAVVAINATYDVPENSAVIYAPYKQIVLQCNSSEKVTMVWKKDDQIVTDINGLKDRIRTTETETATGISYCLLISHGDYSDAGNYTCSSMDNGEEQASAKINVAARVAVRIKTQNINVVEEEKLRIECQALGNPDIEWFILSSNYENETFNETSDRVTISNYKDEHGQEFVNGLLIIDKVNKEDRGQYTCIGYNKFLLKDTTNSTCMVRVKDKYAALWPFLGICAEVIVLCAVIIIYEKKRNKTELEESDTDQSPDQKNTPDHGKEANLRHRQ
ncbi:neuroplastin [Cylas formicarius]|uniref:neuroplastin n=1 Tax=Cylas formicarius TaxID=197179 RepID=UPI002958AE1B|nr:neuroplastin [Cylas formicarius]